MIDKEIKRTEEGEKSKTALINAVLKIVVERGFEGLRTRAVADLAGLNVATLHYYFPTKEVMIAEFMNYISHEFYSTHGPAPEPCGSPALDRLHQEFSDAIYYNRERPDLVAAMGELTLRSRHDPQISARLNTMRYYWRMGLENLIVDGIKEGVFRQDLDPAVMSEILMAVLGGAGMQGLERITEIHKSIEDWIVGPERPGRNDD